MTERRDANGWKIAYWALFVCWVTGAALFMARVNGGFLTNYLADLTFPPYFYIALRGKLTGRPMVISVIRGFGKTPLRAALSIFLFGAITEVSSYFWPLGPFGGTFDRWDIAAYAFGLGICYLVEKRGAPSVLVKDNTVSSALHVGDQTREVSH